MLEAVHVSCAFTFICVCAIPPCMNVAEGLRDWPIVDMGAQGVCVICIGLEIDSRVGRLYVVAWV